MFLRVQTSFPSFSRNEFLVKSPFVCYSIEIDSERSLYDVGRDRRDELGRGDF